MVTGSSRLSPPGISAWTRLPEHDLRYDMADEYMEVVQRPVGIWEPGAHRRPIRESGVLVDHTKVHAIDFEGQLLQDRAAR